MKLLAITISVLMLSGCSFTSFHGEVIEASDECAKGVYSITHAELAEGNTTTLRCIL